MKKKGRLLHRWCETRLETHRQEFRGRWRRRRAGCEAPAAPTRAHELKFGSGSSQRATISRWRVNLPSLPHSGPSIYDLRHNPSLNRNRSSWSGNASHLHTQTWGPLRLRPAMTEVDSQAKMQLSLSTADTECCTHSLIVNLLITLTSRWFKWRPRSLRPSWWWRNMLLTDNELPNEHVLFFWKYYLGKTGCQWPPAGFNELTFRSTSSQPCVVWCPRAAGMKSEDFSGGGF